MKDFALTVLNAKPGETHLFSVGQAGYIVKSTNGQLLGVDLYLSECVERIEGNIGFKRLLPRILELYELEFDYIVTTHWHFDHFDMDAIPHLMAHEKTRMFASVECRKEVDRLRMSQKNIEYVVPGDKYIDGDYILNFIYCDHGESSRDAVGVVVEVDGKKICMTGDTSLRLDWIEEYKKNGKFDVLIAPINGAFGNMNEQDCAELSSVLKPKLTIPSHYGMFAAHGGNPGIFIKKMKEICPENQYYLMTLGEGIVL